MSGELTASLSDLATRLVDMAKKAGAADADALAVCDTGESVRVRHGRIESVEREDAQGIGLRAFVRQRDGLACASASTSDVSASGLEALVRQVIEMARISSPDPDAVPPAGAEHPTETELKQWAGRHAPPAEPWNMEDARQAAMDCEQAALGYAKEISNSEGAEAGFGTTSLAYASADGFCGDDTRTSAALSVSVLAGEGNGMQRDYAFDRALLAERLRDPHAIGREAAERTLSRLGADSMKSCETTVVFEPRMATSLLGHLAGAVNGRAVIQQRSFLTDTLGKQIFPDFVHISDDPDHADGLGNRLFDGEGTRCRVMNVIESGRLTGFLTDRYAARRLHTRPTGHARRGLAGDIGIGTSNLILHPGTISPAEILQEVGYGILVTEMMGFGVNPVTGDYSRGAAGFVIENGKIGRPIQEITVAGNLREMFANIMLVGNDLTWFGSTAVPTVAIRGLAIAGQA